MSRTSLGKKYPETEFELIIMVASGKGHVLTTVSNRPSITCKIAEDEADI